jgi:hypothetical protein
LTNRLVGTRVGRVDDRLRGFCGDRPGDEIGLLPAGSLDDGLEVLCGLFSGGEPATVET